MLELHKGRLAMEIHIFNTRIPVIQGSRYQNKSFGPVYILQFDYENRNQGEG